VGKRRQEKVQGKGGGGVVRWGDRRGRGRNKAKRKNGSLSLENRGIFARGAASKGREEKKGGVQGNA